MYDLFVDLKMVNNGQPVFKKASGKWQTGMAVEHDSILFHVLHGCISNPPDLNMYDIENGQRSDGTPIFRGIRGTSQLEGFHHHFQNQVIRGWVCSPELMDAAVLEFTHTWNVDTRARNCGAEDFGFYDLELLDYLCAGELKVFGQCSYYQSDYSMDQVTTSLFYRYCAEADSGLLPLTQRQKQKVARATAANGSSLDVLMEHPVIHSKLLRKDFNLIMSPNGLGQMINDEVRQLWQCTQLLARQNS